MARMLWHEHPRQRGSCLAGAFAAYVGRIPLVGYPDLDAVWQAVRARPFESDPGIVWVAGQPGDPRCSPVQRSRVWPAAMNCWEATAHFVSGAKRYLDEEWTIHVWDRDLANGARHLWPSLVTPQGDHLLVDLRSTARREYPRGVYSGSYGSGSA